MNIAVVTVHSKYKCEPTLGARDFSTTVSGFYQVFLVAHAKRVFLAASPIMASAFGKHWKFLPHARKSSGTKGNVNLSSLKKIQAKCIYFDSSLYADVVFFLKINECSEQKIEGLWTGFFVICHIFLLSQAV